MSKIKKLKQRDNAFLLGEVDRRFVATDLCTIRFEDSVYEDRNNKLIFITPILSFGPIRIRYKNAVINVATDAAEILFLAHGARLSAYHSFAGQRTYVVRSDHEVKTEEVSENVELHADKKKKSKTWNAATNLSVEAQHVPEFSGSLKGNAGLVDNSESERSSSSQRQSTYSRAFSGREISLTIKALPFGETGDDMRYLISSPSGVIVENIALSDYLSSDVQPGIAIYSDFERLSVTGYVIIRPESLQRSIDAQYEDRSFLANIGLGATTAEKIHKILMKKKSVPELLESHMISLNEVGPEHSPILALCEVQIEQGNENE